jgi:hypothetical protein
VAVLVAVAVALTEEDVVADAETEGNEEGDAEPV